MFTFADCYAISCISLGAIAACCPTLNFTPGVFVACHVAAWRSAAIVQQTGNQNWNKGKSDLFHYLKHLFWALKQDLGQKFPQNGCIPVNIITDSVVLQDKARATGVSLAEQQTSRINNSSVFSMSIKLVNCTEVTQWSGRNIWMAFEAL